MLKQAFNIVKTVILCYYYFGDDMGKIFEFKSPDGKYIADNKMTTCFFNRFTNEELTFEGYQSFCAQYDFLSEDSDEQKKSQITNRRTSLIKYGIEKRYEESIIENQD